jgi:hypothetical protein
LNHAALNYEVGSVCDARAVSIRGLVEGHDMTRHGKADLRSLVFSDHGVVEAVPSGTR